MEKIITAPTPSNMDFPSTSTASNTSQLALFHHLRGNSLIKPSDEAERITIHPNPDMLLRRDAIVPEDEDTESGQESGPNSGGCCERSDVIIVPHVQISAPNESCLYNRAISSGGGLLADLQRATLATHAFYAETNEQPHSRSPWILRRLYEWSNRAKRREMLKHVESALSFSTGEQCEDEELATFLSATWEDMFEGSKEFSEIDRRRLQAVWELFHSELIFLIRQLLVLQNVYKEPLKKCQVEGCLLSIEPELLFGNLEQLCRISRRFCNSFLSLVKEATSNGQESHYPTTELVVQLFDKFSKGPSTISAYQAYCINYKATIEYLGLVRQKEDRFPEFERACMLDPRCGRLQLEDLLISPLQRITRLPILIKEILRYTELTVEKQRLEKVLETMNESLRSIDDSVQWLHNFERLQQLQRQVIWPAIMEIEPKTYIPDFLKGALSRQFCENLLAHPRRKLIYEGNLEYIENGRIIDCYAFLFNDMFLITRIKKFTTKSKNRGTSSSAVNAGRCDYYIVHKQPVPLDSCVFCDADSNELNGNQNALKNAFVVIHLTRYYQVVQVYTLQTVSKKQKEAWIEKFQESIENYESIQLKDMLRCTPLFSSLNFRRSSSGSSCPNIQSFSPSREHSIH